MYTLKVEQDNTEWVIEGEYPTFDAAWDVGERMFDDGDTGAFAIVKDGNVIDYYDGGER